MLFEGVTSLKERFLLLPSPLLKFQMTSITAHIKSEK